MCRVLGSDECETTDSFFHAILSARDIDDVTAFKITLGPSQSINDTMPIRGIEPIEIGTYYDACLIGVAPPPTNAVQKAIWDKVHAIPKTPMKIEFDPKKGR